MRILSILSGTLVATTIVFIVIFLLTKIFVKIFPNLKTHFYKIFLAYFLLVLGIYFGRSGDVPIFQILYFIGAFFTGTIILNAIILIPAFFIKIFIKNNYTKFLQIAVIVGLLTINIHSIYAGFVPKIVNYEVNFREHHNFHGKKFILIADTHYGYIHGELEAKILVEKINEINPEFVIIAGDFFDGPKIDYEKIAKIFDAVNAPIFYANGNHEEYGNTNEILSAIAKTKIQILNNEIINFGGIEIAGVSYHLNKDENSFATILETIRPSENRPSILIKHEPKWHLVSEKFGFDLVVSGHTHRGQMWPISLIPEKIYGKYVYGLSQDNSQYALTTSGVGNWGPPQRLGSQSEIVVVNIE